MAQPSQKPSATVRAQRIEAELGELADGERAAQEQRYLKSTLRHLGVRVPAIRGVVRAELRRLPATRGATLALARALWKRPVHELRMAAGFLLEARAGLLSPEDMKLLERFIREARTWALVDTLAVHVVGALLAGYPAVGKQLDRWARDDDFWIRRSALLSPLVGLRRGAGDFARFCRYADAMLEEDEFFVRKAIGWVLRETAKQDPDAVFAFLAPRVPRASGVTVREAVKPLSAARRREILAAYRAGRAARPR